MIKFKMLLAPEGEGVGAVAAAAGATGDTGTPAAAEKSITGEAPKTDAAPAKSLVDGAEGKSGEKGGAQAEADKGAADLKLKVPEGMDAKVAEPYLAAAKKHGLKGEAAQEFFDLALKAGQESRTTFENTVKSNWEKTQAQWLDEARKDPEIGGDKFKESVANADKAVRRFGGDQLMDILIQTGLGKNPLVIKAFAKAGAAISEDSIGGTTGGKGSPGKLSEKQALMRDFPNSPEMWKHLPD